MNCTFQVENITKHRNGDVEVTLDQVYDHTTRQLNDSTNPEGEITLQITDKTGFFQQGQKYLVNFRSMAPITSGAIMLANGQAVDQAEQAAWLKAHPNKTQADYVNYMNSVVPPKGDGTHDNDPHRFDRTDQSPDFNYETAEKVSRTSPKPFGA
jgi:hypothetical protein